MAPSPPREIEPIPRKDAYEFWDTELGSIAAACSIAGAGAYALVGCAEYVYSLLIVWPSVCLLSSTSRMP